MIVIYIKAFNKRFKTTYKQALKYEDKQILCTLLTYEQVLFTTESLKSLL